MPWFVLLILVCFVRAEIIDVNNVKNKSNILQSFIGMKNTFDVVCSINDIEGVFLS